MPGAQLFVGDYQARAVPVADTDAATTLRDKVSLVPGTYDFLVRAPGHGHARRREVESGPATSSTSTWSSRGNVASSASGATATGDGQPGSTPLIDDDEATNWASLGSPVAGKQVTVDLAAVVRRSNRVQVSALLRPPIGPADPTRHRRAGSPRCGSSASSPASIGPVDCTDAADFRSVFTSTADAFPSVAPRPRAPELAIKSFDIRRHQGNAPAVGGADQPVHGWPGLRG